MELNDKARPYGIQFADAQVGERVNYLDVTLYKENKEIHYVSIYRKKTDARQYLNTVSFHPPDVFRSVAFSQMLRVISRNSKDETAVMDLSNLKDDLMRAGHKEDYLEELEPQAVLRAMETYARNKRADPEDEEKKPENIVFTTKYFSEVGQLKKFVRDLQPDFARLAGEHRVIFRTEEE